MSRPATVLIAMLVITSTTTIAADELPFEEEAAIRAAVARVAPSTVRIEPTGVSEAALGQAAEASPATGPSTGLVIKPGWVLTTAFAVPKDSGEVIVVLPDAAKAGDDPSAKASGGTRRVAKVVGRDMPRGLVLLRVEEANLPAVTEWVTRADLATGQWAIAVGRAWDLAQPNVAVGVVSAVNRAWGRAVQTDALISPANYGGPLIDIAGRVIGVLAPLAADTAGMNLGTELYDSGIGFAVPLEDIVRVLPRLESGEWLAAGVLGIGYASRDPFTAPARIATCRAGSPAAKAGLRPGDTIVSADGRAVSRIAELRHALATHYAGDVVEIGIERPRKMTEAADDAPAVGETSRLTVRVELVKELPAWRRPMLGIVPERTSARDTRAQAVKVAWLWHGSPAARAGVQVGDLIEAVAVDAAEEQGGGDEVAVESAAALAGVIAGMEPGRQLRLTLSRGGRRENASLEATTMPVELPGDLVNFVPAFAPQRAAVKPGGAAVTIDRLEAAEVAKPPLVILPNAPLDEPLGVLVYLDSPHGETARQEAAVWEPAVARYGVAVILPGSSDPQRWGREDVGDVKRAIATLAAARAIDPARIAVAGRGAGGAFAWIVAEGIGPAVRGVAILEASLPRQATIDHVEPGRSRWVLFGAGGQPPSTKVMVDRKRLENAGYTVGSLPAGADVPVDTLVAWVEALGML